FIPMSPGRRSRGLSVLRRAAFLMGQHMVSSRYGHHRRRHHGHGYHRRFAQGPYIAPGSPDSVYGIAGNNILSPSDRNTTVTFDIRGADGEFARLIRKMVRVQGGNVQSAFGR